MSLYSVIQFDEDGGNGLAIVNNNWFSPRKTEVFWPPHKDNQNFNRALKQGDEIDTNKWQLYKVKRRFYETDDIEKAHKKLKLAEDQSDLNSSFSERESQSSQRKRKIRKPMRLLDSSADESDGDDPPSKCTRPGPIKFSTKDCEKDKHLAQSSPKPSCSKNIDSCSDSLNQGSSQNLSGSGEGLKLGCSVQGSRNLSFNINRDINNNGSNLGSSEFSLLMKGILHLQEQNEQVINLLKKSVSPITPSTSLLNLPTSLPVLTQECLKLLEDHLAINKETHAALVSYLTTIGGRDARSKTNKVLKTLITDSLASQFNFYGTNNKDKTAKKSFASLILKKIVIESVQATCQVTELEVENSIKVWLKHAPERLKRKENSVN